MAAAIDEETVAVMLAGAGDAGVILATLDYLRGIERLCRQRGVLLILDEVQDRQWPPGALLAEKLGWYVVRADIVTLGKGLAPGCRCRRCWRVRATAQAAGTGRLLGDSTTATR